MWQIIVKEASLLMISKLIALQFDYATKSFEENFETLRALVASCEKHSLVLAPELCLSAYSYENLEESAKFSQKILPQLRELSRNKSLCLTLTQEIDGKFYNNAKIFYDTKEVYSQAKVKLFALGGEPKYFQSGKTEDIKAVDVYGVKLSILICFELRFIELWERLRGSDVILIPSYWGKPRKSHLRALSIALAIANQCFVVVSNSTDMDMASGSCIIDPFGEVVDGDNLRLVSAKYDKRLIKKMRRYMDIGLDV